MLLEDKRRKLSDIVSITNISKELAGKLSIETFEKWRAVVTYMESPIPLTSIFGLDYFQKSQPMVHDV